MNTKQVTDLTQPCTVEKWRFAGGDGEDELVDCEMEAAQALACLAHPGSKNNESLVPGPSGRSEEQAIAMHGEEESELKASLQQTLNYPPVASRRSRKNLTEEEKEERRLCRVLANRESARQTICRRQVMYEELTRKAADLASENKYLKKKKELEAKEFDSLKNENTSLRIQIAKIEKKAEAEETAGCSKSKPIEISTAPTATATPTPHFNQSPITPFFWPSIVQPFSGFFLQCGSKNISDITSVLPSPTSGDLNSVNRQESFNPGNPLFVFPFPCLIPFNPQSSLFLPWSSTEKHAETSSVHQCSTSYPNMEYSQATERDFLHEAALGFPSDGGSSEGNRQPSGVHSREVGPMTGTSGQIELPQQDNTNDFKAGYTSEKTSQESIASEKLVDVVAATEARKRRKELLKLKGHYSDQFGSHH